MLRNVFHCVEEAMPVALANPLESQSVAHLAMTRSVLGTDRAIAGLLDVSPSQVSRWRRGQVPDPDNADRLAGLALVVEMLARWLHPETVVGWLHGPNLHLDGRTPAYLIRHGRLADVIGAIEMEKAGSFA